MADIDLLPRNDFSRRIIHLDMDAFYASVEMRDRPELANKAVVIAQDPRKTGGHGVIATANYRARKYGVGSAMAAAQAVKLIPAEELVFVEPDFAKYHRVSGQVHGLMHELTDQIESVALDEAYMDVTWSKIPGKSALELARYLQEQIFRQLHLTSSFGVSYNKFLAKMGSEYAKPFGRTYLAPDRAQDFLDRQEIKRFPGIGKKTQERLKEAGVLTGRDIRNYGLSRLLKDYKKSGYYMALHAYGIDLSPVQASRQRKSLGKERTFEPVIYDPDRADAYLKDFSQTVAAELKERNLLARVVVLKVRDRNFKTITRRQQIQPTSDPEVFYQLAKELLAREPEFLAEGIRLLGLSAGELEEKHYQEISLFADE
ncbi:DNA polymerase IV [Lactobacillus delbrueckii]|uniref:DNA polymerase IV n=1 Tax=Lactobacillus delbrueckii TaxID=1584 RepID=UPI003A8482FC